MSQSLHIIRTYSRTPSAMWMHSANTSDAEAPPADTRYTHQRPGLDSKTFEGAALGSSRGTPDKKHVTMANRTRPRFDPICRRGGDRYTDRYSPW